MLVSTQTDILGQRYGDEQAIRITAQAGFDAFDLSLFPMLHDPNYPMNGPDFRNYARKLRSVAEEAGIVCNQAHAPFPSSTDDDGETEIIHKMLIRAMEGAAIVGAKAIVIHPKQHLPYADNRQTLKEMNLEFYRSLIPYAEQFGIQIALENMWQYDVDHICHSTCASPAEFCEYLDLLDSPWTVACLDLGHVSLVHEDFSDMIHALGPKRLRALHVHDTDYFNDLHTLPFMGKMDYPAIVQALADIGYEGDLTLEADNFYQRIPDELVSDAARFMYRTARCLADQIEGK